MTALANDPVVDPSYGIQLPRAAVTEHIAEAALSAEEVRINRANKTSHTVYNTMAFPDPLDRGARTIAATCTRVSRESIIITVPEKPGEYRRLTLRERASLQGFPVTFQFYGANYGQKLRMIGNAVPPAFAYLMGNVLQERPANRVLPLTEVGRTLKLPRPLPVETPPERVANRYRAGRTFKFAIPSLRLKSGVRFEFCNTCAGEDVSWRLQFFFGSSKSIQTLQLNEDLSRFLLANISPAMHSAVAPFLAEMKRFIRGADLQNMQAVWAHRRPGGTRPFMVLDKLDEVGAALVSIINECTEARHLVEKAIENEHGASGYTLPGVGKLTAHAATILAGLLIGSTVNPELDEHARRGSCNGTGQGTRRRSRQ